VPNAENTGKGFPLVKIAIPLILRSTFRPIATATVKKTDSNVSISAG
jgi:hypothetical protein